MFAGELHHDRQTVAGEVDARVGLEEPGEEGAGKVAEPRQGPVRAIGELKAGLIRLDLQGTILRHLCVGPLMDPPPQRELGIVPPAKDRGCRG